ncbi:UbiA prenyltransferase [Chloroherpeton thalassium ATCC 35110]|uniref:UbiA prenyltransferase n=1 Tax=Chloroherpeton thalassium (strain ATCC 35110 / GB-78) TaxID=517418 RepID=B3QVN9_CHLT3|nr:UbiA family prenyltransferase [Chloroherpeton thalassium]ACF13096.1 UbiA prenyltransferase [Chloroherpeton thalassium ATCC 35110]
MQLLLRALDYVFLLRPTLMFPVWITMMCGFAVRTEPDFFTNSPLPYFALLLFSLSAGTTYIFNQIADRESDFHNNKLFLLSHHHISLTAAWIEAVLLTLFSLVLSTSISMAFFWVQVAVVVAGICYSFFGFMSHPALGLLINFLGGIFSFLGGYFAIPDFQSDLFDQLMLSLPYGFAWGAVYLLVSIPDVAGDKKFGKNTIAVVHGEKRAMFDAFLLVLIAALLGALTQNFYVLITVGLSGLISTPYFFKVFADGDLSKISTPVKLSMLLLSFALFFSYPMLLALLAATVLLSRFYYQKRFGLKYP